MMLSTTQIITFSLLFIAVVIGLVVFAWWWDKRKIRAIITDLGASGSDGLWHFNARGKRVRLFYFEGGRSSFPLVSLSINGKFKCHCVIRKEQILDKAAKSSGLNKEISVVDPEVDSKIYFECEDEDFIQSLTQNPGIKNVLMGALKHFSFIKIEDDVCILEKTPGNLAAFKSEQIKKAAEAFADFINYIPQAESAIATLTPQTVAFESKLRIWGGLVLGLAVIGIFPLYLDRLGYYPPVFPAILIKRSLLVSGSLLGVLLIFLLKFWGGHASSAKRIFCILIFGAFGICLGTWGFIRVLNGALDKSNPVNFETYVMEKYVSISSRYGDHYHLVLKPWKKQQPPDNFIVSKAYYDHTPEFARCFVDTKAGFWNYEWISERRCKQGPPRKLQYLKLSTPELNANGEILGSGN